MAIIWILENPKSLLNIPKAIVNKKPNVWLKQIKNSTAPLLCFFLVSPHRFTSQIKVFLCLNFLTVLFLSEFRLMLLLWVRKSVAVSMSVCLSVWLCVIVTTCVYKVFYPAAYLRQDLKKRSAENYQNLTAAYWYKKVYSSNFEKIRWRVGYFGLPICF